MKASRPNMQALIQWAALAAFTSLMLGSFIVGLAGVIMMVVEIGAKRPGISSFESGFLRWLFVGALLFPVSYLVFIVSSRWRFRLQRAMTTNAQDALARDRRPPVLYLRSFSEDDEEEPFLPNYGGWQEAVVALSGLAKHASMSQEEWLVKQLRQIGPVVAIGDPRDGLPKLGAARFAIDSSEWREKVTELMRRSRLVVVRPGFTLGVWWKIEKAIHSIPSNRIIFWLPAPSRTGRDMNAAYAQLSSMLAKYVREPLPKLKKQHSFLCFERNWKQPGLKLASELMGNRPSLIRRVLPRGG